MDHINTFPNELLYEIALFVATSSEPTSDLLSMCLVCHQCYNITKRVLYRNIKVKYIGSKVIAIARSILDDKDKAQATRSLRSRLVAIDGYPSCAPESDHRSIVPALLAASFRNRIPENNFGYERNDGAPYFVFLLIFCR
ncbi:hypothetical protein M501DRAFT_994161 [Patellaria atrata CBS 101060]|uniref:F-box domain-containing protein n=1 Tax=Patellaria atrata CBS 101060 TaxID=1346257 RepID=A0A9P4VVQ0_9PEZI|nr:hypothetical protein M501DRAFT_994161 [Patellaria atrata CBS 101060]